MSKAIYYPEEVRKTMEDIITKKMWRLLRDDNITNETIASCVESFRSYIYFADMVCKALEGEDDADT